MANRTGKKKPKSRPKSEVGPGDATGKNNPAHKAPTNKMPNKPPVNKKPNTPRTTNK